MTSPPLDSTHGRKRRLWHEITALGKHTRSNDVRRGMKSPLWTAHTVERCHAWHFIIAYGQQTRSNNVGCGMTSPPLDSTHGRTTSGVTCHHRLWTAHTVEQRRAWHDITVLGLHARSDDFRRGMTSLPLDSTHDRQRRAWHDITALGQHTRSATSGVA